MSKRQITVMELKSEKSIKEYLKTLPDDTIIKYYLDVEYSPFPVLLIEGIYNWYFEAWDYATNFVSSVTAQGNRTLTIDVTSPNIDFVSPTLNNETTGNDWIFVNVSSDG